MAYSPDQTKKLQNAFFTYGVHGKRRGTFINCVSRLWWAAHIFYDSTAKNPYHLVTELAKTGFSSTLLIVSSSRIMSHRPTLHTFFRVLQERRAKGDVISQKQIAHAIEHLNLIAGMTLLDCLLEHALRIIIEESFDEHFSKM